MKILIVSPFENTATGRGDRNLRLDQELRQRGHEVTFLTSNFDHAQKDSIDEKKLVSGPGLKVIHVPKYSSNIGFARIWCHFVFSLKMWVFAIQTKWDAVVVSSVPPEALFCSTILRRKALVVDIRDIWPDALRAYGNPSIAMRIFVAYCDLIYSLSLKRADLITIVAPGFRSWLTRYISIKPGKVKFVPLGFRRDDFRPLDKGNGDFEFCYAGGATPQFDIREFVDDFRFSKGIILGSGPLLDAWKKSFISSEFRGVVPRTEAMRVMAESNKLLFPSNPYAQLPNKAFDYFALGHKVVLGSACSRSTRYLLSLRWRNVGQDIGDWRRYQVLEKESLTYRMVRIVESVAAS